MDELISYELKGITNTLSKNISDKSGNILPDSFRSENIYNGISGVIIYLHKYIKITNDNTKLRLLKNCILYLIKIIEERDATNWSFYTGRLGSFYVLNKVSGDLPELELEDYLKKLYPRLLLLKNWDDKTTKIDLLSGTLGIILGLIANFPYYKSFIVPLINSNLSKVVNELKITESGINFGSKYYNINSINGLAHGTAGLAAIFVEVSKLFKNDFLNFISNEIVNDQNTFYSPDIDNWKDNRLGIGPLIKIDVAISKYLKKKLDFFDNKTSELSWCNGSVGIGFSRLLSSQLENNHSQGDLLKVAHSVNDDFNLNKGKKSYTLCHGFGGHLSFLVEYTKINRDEGFNSLCKEIIYHSIKHKNKHGAYMNGANQFYLDVSLFNGISGIGYMYLSYLNKFDDNILIPGNFHSGNTLSSDKELSSNILNVILSNNFPLTFEKGYISNFDWKKYNPKMGMQKAVDEMAKDRKIFSEDFYRLDKAKIELRSKKFNRGLNSIKDRVSAMEQYTFDQIQYREAVLSKSQILLNLSDNYVLIMEKFGEVLEINLTQLEYSFLVNFKEVTSIHKFFDNSKNKNSSKKSSVIKKERVIDFIRLGILEILN